MNLLMRVRTVFDYGQGGPGLMTHYFAFTAPGTAQFQAADAQVAVDRVRDFLLTGPNLWPATFHWTVQGGVDVLQDTDGVVVGHLAGLDRTGAGANNAGLGPLPVGILLRAHTGAFIGSRRLIGRTFLVPISSGGTQGTTVPGDYSTVTNAMGVAMLNQGTTLVIPWVWSRPRAATAVSPHHPAGAARAARLGSSSPVTSYTTSPKYAILRSRRD